MVLYSGSIAPGSWQGEDVTIQDVFEGVGRHAAGTMTDEELAGLEAAACPGAGACGAQYTANTMATVLEFLGIAASAVGKATGSERKEPRPHGSTRRSVGTPKAGWRRSR